MTNLITRKFFAHPRRFLFAASLACSFTFSHAPDVHAEKALSHTATSDTTSGAGNFNTDSFWKLYKAGNYAGAANLFESMVASGRPDANAFYYAALANQQIYKNTRAKQLFKYVVSAFPGTSQATYAQKCLDASAPAVDPKAVTASKNTELPATIKNALPANMQSLLNTDAGKLAVAQAMKDQAGNIETISRAEKKGILNQTNIAAATASAGFTGAQQTRKRGEHPFSAEQIAREGKDGIDQTNAPNCWFESAMSALAQLPKGQRMISQMITYGEGNTYLVRFPGDGVEYKVTESDLKASGVNSTAMWASLLDYAERQKFPNNVGASGVDADKHRLQTGLGAITGSSAEMLYPTQASKQDIPSFIYGAVSSQNPCTAGTAGRNRSVAAPSLKGTLTPLLGSTPRVVW